MSNIEKAEVLIVGAGPTGLAAANELVRLGINVKLIDKNEQRSIHSKALGVQAGTLEALEKCFGEEFSQSMVSSGLKAQKAFVQLFENQFIELELSNIPSIFNYVLILPQSKTEQILEERLNSNNVYVDRQCELVELKQENEKVISIMRKSDGSEVEVHSGFVIGADGAHSKVRHSLGLSFEGELYENEFMLGDLNIEWPWNYGDIRAFITENGILACFPLNKNGDYRVVIANSNNPPKKANELELKDLEEQIEIICPGKIKIKKDIWLSRFRVHHRMTSTFQKGRVFLAGDSAHIHSPVGGQGMNIGIQDALNLGSKLALVIRDNAPIDFLSNYDKERLPVARKVLRGTDFATKLGLKRNKLFIKFGSKIAYIFLKNKFIQNKLLRAISETH